MSKRFLGILVIIVLALGVVYWSTNRKSDKGSASSSSSSSSQLSSHILGKGTTGVTLVEYGDYQCPYCGQYYPLIKSVTDKYQDQIAFQFRNFPLSQVHQNAFAGARAAEAAGLQNKYWEMHDLLYEQQNSWQGSTNVEPVFEQYATELGLNLTKFKTDYASSAVNNVINADESEGTKLGVQGTPTFFLQGKQLNPSPTTAAGFEKLIDATIAKNKK